jgi:hypothetical protein
MSAIQTTTKIKSAQQAKVVPQDKEEIAKLIHIVEHQAVAAFRPAPTSI